MKSVFDSKNCARASGSGCSSSLSTLYCALLRFILDFATVVVSIVSIKFEMPALSKIRAFIGDFDVSDPARRGIAPGSFQSSPSVGFCIFE